MDHLDRAILARQELVELGLVEDSGQRRPDKTGVMQVVWRLSPLGGMVAHYQKHQGITLEQALAKVNASGGNALN